MQRRIRILHIINSLEIGGAEVLLSETLPKMDSSNFENSVAFLIGKGSLRQALTAYNIEVHDLSLKGKLHPLLLVNLLYLVESTKPDIVHTHTIQSDMVGQLTSMVKRVGIRITTQHSAYHPKNWSILYRLARALTRRASVVIAVSEYCRDYLARSLGYDLGHLRVVPNGIDLSRFPPNTQRCHTKNSIKIGTLGRLHTQKGLHDLTKAMRYVDSDIGIQCFIPGTGKLEQSLRAAVKHYGLEEKIVFLGNLDAIEKVAYLKSLDIFVHPSLWEAFGISVLEAMATGLPIIATDVEGIPGLIHDGRTGILVPPGDEHGLARAIVYLSRNPDARRKLGINARQMAEHFSISETVAELEKIYRSAFLQQRNVQL